MSTIRLKRGTTAGYIPSGLTWGEPAVNTTDGILFCGNTYGNTINLSGVLSFNGSTGDIEGVSSVNGSTGDVTLTDLVGVNTWNGLSGDVTGVSNFAGFTGTVASGVTTNHVPYHNGSAITGSDSFTYNGTDLTVSDGGATFGGDVNFLGNAIVATGGYLQWPDGTTQGTTPIQRFYANTLLAPSSTDYDEFELISNRDDIAITTIGGSNRIKYAFASGTNIPKLDEQNTFTGAGGNAFTASIGANRYTGNSMTEVWYAELDHASATYMGITSGTVNFKILGTDILDMDSDIHAYVGISADAGATFGGNVNITGSGNYLQFPDGTTQGAAARTYVEEIIGINVDNGTSVLTTGVKGHRVLPYDCEVTEWTVTTSGSAGAIQWDVNWVDYANFPNGLASVAGSDLPNIAASGNKNQDKTVGWTKTTFSTGDILQFEIDSVTTLTNCNLAIKIRRTS